MPAPFFAELNLDELPARPFKENRESLKEYQGGEENSIDTEDNR